VEVAASWSPTRAWRVSAGWAWLEMRLHRDASSRDGSATAIENDNPSHQLHARSSVDLPRRVSFDAALYRVGELPGLVLNLNGRAVPLIAAVPAYTRVDLRLGWRPHERFELAVTGQNLLDPEHAEFRDTAATSGHSTEIRRSIYGKAAWRF
jgi:iron complex outermembrane receptor protein